MLNTVPAGFGDLLDDATPATLILTTLRRDGLPVLSPLWFVAEEEGLLVTIGPDSLKARHLRHDPRVAAIILAPDDHNRYLHLHGQARARPDLDTEVVYRRALWRYEHRAPEGPCGLVVFEVLPTTIRGFDYRDVPLPDIPA